MTKLLHEVSLTHKKLTNECLTTRYITILHDSVNIKYNIAIVKYA